MARSEPSAEASEWKEKKHHMGFILKEMIPNPQFWKGRINLKEWSFLEQLYAGISIKILFRYDH